MATDVEFGGFIKTTVKTADGTLNFQNVYSGNPGVSGIDATKTQFSAQESRLNTTVISGDIKGFVEIDFIGSSQGNTYNTNSYSPRLRHAYIDYKGLTVGQTWSTMVNPSSYPESTNLGGGLIGEAFVRQALVRYTYGNWQFAMENPSTEGRCRQLNEAGKEILTGCSKAEDAIPDMVVRHNSKGDWGNLSAAVLVRSLEPRDSREVAVGGSIAGKINVFDQDDLRFQLHYGNLGRYVGAGSAYDIFDNELETTTGGMVAYRHFWTENMRTTAFYSHITTEEQNADRRHMAINLFTNIAPGLVFGAELGRYEVNDDTNSFYTEANAPANGDSNYLQLSMQFFF
ncbi:DcaP family trimeric outer membrane transporter [Shewanella sp. GXUN23E]|uniref:DcaP family trimeric outer membrane transporter n=1 Tax=Shewanella sp. GXUN23E TaxID=3422498 RepID=UPI003D7DA1F7